VTALKAANLLLLALFPVAWFAPLLRAGLLPVFGMDEISVISGLAVLMEEAPILAALVALFALVAPVAKSLALALVHWGGPRRLMHLVHLLGRLAMADIFLIALYIVAAKGVGVGRVETAWGLWLFTGCVLGSLVVAHLTERALKGPAAPV
jgi:paraquat-inducible protein A